MVGSTRRSAWIVVRAETVAVICRKVIIAPRHMAIRVTGREPRTDVRVVTAGPVGAALAGPVGAALAGPVGAALAGPVGAALLVVTRRPRVGVLLACLCKSQQFPSESPG
ncbi:hypothetical protein MILUP08_40627 [Micromonospora lupini str. Lupac 08]|uniref:Uncharacterized protein n=1 Tax=Micromonospora lupini str. Lupac 08 TaxID=1150864 RepID=I0KVX0_9ACTN|nr:hypothetical protein MILUP08_40627 [Micromonospora lupini str. Lupac 08]